MAQAERLEQMKKDAVLLSKHQHKIFFSDDYWTTYVKDSGCKRGLRKLRGKTQDELERKIVQYYKDYEENPSVSDAFDMWMNDRIEYQEIKAQSITRMKNNFQRYFKSIMSRAIKNVTEGDLTQFIKSIIVQFNLSHKQYADIRTIIRGLWRYSRDKGWTDLKIVEYFQEIYLPRGMFRVPEKHAKNKVFTSEDAIALTNYLRKSNYLTDMGLLLQFETGMRIGELSALKWEDIYDDFIHVHRTEVHYTENGHDKKTVQDIPKSDAGDREVILTDNAKRTVHSIKIKHPFGEYVFERADGSRIAESCFNRRLTVVCKRLGIEKASSHKIRRTFATNLINAGTDESLIREMMGHSDISTTRKYYYYADQTVNEKRQQLEKAIAY